MGDELVNSSSPSEESESGNDELSSLLYTDCFYEHFPFYLSIGMTYDQYWNEDSTLVKYYRKAYELQKDRRNHELWLQGLYVYEAIGDMSPVLHAFAKKGTKPVKYPSEPYPLTNNDLKKRKVDKEKMAYDKAKARMSSFATAFNEKFNLKEG